MSEFEDIVETGFGALVLSFGVLAGAAVYSSGSVGAVPGVLERFADALWLTFVPPLSAGAWPNVVALLLGCLVVAELEESWSIRLAGFVATYVSVAVVLLYATAPV